MDFDLIVEDIFGVVYSYKIENWASVCVCTVHEFVGEYSDQPLKNVYKQFGKRFAAQKPNSVSHGKRHKINEVPKRKCIMYIHS